MAFDLKKMQSLFPKQIVTRVIDYNDKCYVAEVVNNLGETNYGDPYYVVSKKSGEKQIFLPNVDLEIFFDRLEKHTVYSIND